MNRTLKEATVCSYHYSSHAHLAAFLNTHNHANRLKSIRGLNPHQFSLLPTSSIGFKVNTLYPWLGLNI